MASSRFRGIKRIYLVLPIVVIVIIVSVIAFSYIFTPAPKEYKTIRYGYVVLNMDGWPIQAGIKQGFFESEGIKVDVTTFSGGSEVASAVAVGAIDIGSVTLLTALRAQAGGAPIKVIAITLNYPAGWHVVVKQDSPIRSIDDIRRLTEEGRTITWAVSRAGAATETYTLMILSKYNISRDKVKFIYVGDQMIEAVVTGQADVATADFPRPAIAISQGKVRSIADLGKELPPHGVSVMIATDKFIKENPELIKAFIRAYLKSMKWIIDNKESAIGIISNVTNVPRDVAEILYNQITPAYNLDGTISTSVIRNAMNIVLLATPTVKLPSIDAVYAPGFVPVGD